MSRYLTVHQPIVRRQNVRRIVRPLISFTRWEWLAIAALLALTLGSALLSVWSSAQRVHYGRQITAAIYERQDQVNQRNAKMVTIQDLTNRARLEQEAKRLGLAIPQSDQIIKIATDYAEPTTKP